VKLLRIAVSLGLLAYLAVRLGPAGVAGSLARLDPRWLALGLGVAVTHILVLAWRWRFTSVRMGVPLPFPEAMREYWLAALLNQTLPGGVVGDVSRAWRQVRRGGAEGGSSMSERADEAGVRVHAVILERVVSQLVMGGVAGAAAVVLLLSEGGAPPDTLARIAGGLGAGIVLVLLALRWFLRLPFPEGGQRHRIREQARAALLDRGALAGQVASALGAAALLTLLFLIAARAVGVDTPSGRLLPLIPLVLVSMLLPLSIGGWGIREGTAALLWGGVGLPQAEGVAISVTYGLLALAATAPGALALLPRFGFRAGVGDAVGAGGSGAATGAVTPRGSGGPGRRGRRSREESGGSAGAALDRASGSYPE
jgi:glycosyltransferase 2 family protein